MRDIDNPYFKQMVKDIMYGKSELTDDFSLVWFGLI